LELLGIQSACSLQDVSEFMHIVLEWVEEAFKELESTPGDSLSNVPQVEVMDESSSDQVLLLFFGVVGLDRRY
jgi:hypothetical protein